MSGDLADGPLAESGPDDSLDPAGLPDECVDSPRDLSHEPANGSFGAYVNWDAFPEPFVAPGCTVARDAVQGEVAEQLLAVAGDQARAIALVLDAVRWGVATLPDEVLRVLREAGTLLPELIGGPRQAADSSSLDLSPFGAATARARKTASSNTAMGLVRIQGTLQPGTRTSTR